MTLSRYVLFVYTGGVQEVLLNGDARDNCTEPYIHLRNSFESTGYKFEWTANRPLEDYDWIFFLNVYSAGYAKPLKVILRKAKNFIYGRPLNSVFQEALKNRLKDRMVLMLTEPPSVCPENYDRKFHRYFGHIFTWKRDWADNGCYHRFYYPTTSIFPAVEDVPFSAKKLLADISGNKLSTHERELYSERRRTIQFFEANYPDDFDLYGTGWNEPSQKAGCNLLGSKEVDDHHYASYRGSVKNKWDILPRYKFTICYENILGETDYITNRFFDVIRCNSVPIYWGAPNISDYVDQQVFISREDLSSNEDLAEYLIGMTEEEYRRFIEAGKRYLESEKFKLFLSDNYVETIFSFLGITK